MADNMKFNLADMEDEDVDVDDEMKEEVEVGDSKAKENGKKDKHRPIIPELPESSKTDKTLKEVLDMMDGEYAPIIPDAVTDFYLAKNGLQCPDVKIKRLLALATQKFISDIATDAYEYSRIGSTTAVYNSNNPQARARALVSGQVGAGSNKQEKIVLTQQDLSSALSEYGLNINRPDFYR